MHYPTKRIHFGDLVFDVNDDVYEPAEDSFLFVENLDVKKDQIVLDLGTGSGILAVSAARKDTHVIAVDLNPYAIQCARANAKLNNVSGNIDFLQSDLFSAFCDDVQFDVVLFNAPYLPSEESEDSSWIERAWAGGANGRAIVDRFIAQVPAYLNSDGRVLLMQSTLTGVDETLQAFTNNDLRASVVATQKLPFFETLTLIEAKAKG